ncbi:MAG: hypothetical protein CMI53_03475 [Parcubacteria group bacterium]|nr:hypothetical protein [Parcubacteria group bacterium]|tara:strand:- start:1362 stop:3053 length:1692 start_codon:yes stop_codon:yes gene_type:complete
MKINSRYFAILFLIVILAGVLRFYDLDRADVINDEVIIGFRSIGLIDFFSSPYQTTPWEWFSDVPTWAKISFHDHPPLIFLIQHLSFLIFGQTIFALRLPFVLAGIGSVLLLYFIGKQLFNKQIGIIASLLLAVSSYHVWVSRTGLQESMVIFFSLLAFYFFIKVIDSHKYYQWGIVLGLTLLTKHTALILLPIFFSYLLFFKRTVFKDKRFWLAILLIAILFSPVIIYNLKLYQARGYFDLQYSYLFNQEVPDWESLPGKEQAGSFLERTKNLIPAFYQGMLWPMFILFVLSLLVLFRKFFKTDLKLSFDQEAEQNLRPYYLLVLTILFYFLFFLLVGPAKRFIVMSVPFMIVLIAWLIYLQKKVIQIVLVTFLIAIEIFFSANTLLTHHPVGPQGLTNSYLAIESYSWGYNQLDAYLDQLLYRKSPEVTFETRYQFLEDLKKEAALKATRDDAKPESILIIYDNNMYDLATFWLFHRRMVYQGWPVITSEDYLDQGRSFWTGQGINNFYFVKILDNKILLQPIADQTNSAEILVEQLNDLTPDIIKRPDGREVFAVYHWQS